jgi:hypothetical protein
MRNVWSDERPASGAAIVRTSIDLPHATPTIANDANATSRDVENMEPPGVDGPRDDVDAAELDITADGERRPSANVRVVLGVFLLRPFVSGRPRITVREVVPG